MLNYPIVEISGKQFKVEKDQPFLVDYLGETKIFECDRVVLKVEDGKLSFGSPYLKEKLKFEVLGQVKSKKVRVATYHAKANTRKVKGAKALASKLMLAK